MSQRELCFLHFFIIPKLNPEISKLNVRPHNTYILGHGSKLGNTIFFITGMKTKCRPNTNYANDIAKVPAKGREYAEADKLSKLKSKPKIAKKRKLVPAKGLERAEDDSESEFELENESDKEDALNYLAEQSHLPEETAGENVLSS